MTDSTPQPFGGLTEFARRVLLAAGVVLAVVLLLLALWYAVHALLVAFAGVLLVILVRTPADWLSERTGLSEGWSLGLVAAVIVALLAGLGFLVAPQITEQTQKLAQQLPESLQEARRWLEQYPTGRWLVGMIPAPGDSQDGGPGEIFWQATGMAYTAVQAFFGILVLLFVAVYLAVHPSLYTKGLLRLVPRHQRPRAAEILGATGYTLRWWLLGTLLRMVAVGLMTFVGLWLLGVPLALVLALLAFLLDFVPYFGPIVAAIPAILLSFLDGPQQVLYVTLLYVVVQQIESLLISPLIYERTVYLPPVATILAQVVLYAMVGALGIILATPLTAVALVWVKMLYVEEVLGDRIDTPDEEITPEDVPEVPGDGSETRDRTHAERQRRASGK